MGAQSQAQMQPGFPRGRFSNTRRNPGANPSWEGPPSLPGGHWDLNSLNFLLEAWRGSQALASGLGSILRFSWLDSEIFPFIQKLSAHPNLA